MTARSGDQFDGIEIETPVGSFRAGRNLDDDPDYRDVRRRVKRRFGFFKHIATFVTLLGVLLAIDLAIDSGEFFVHWVALVWGIFLALHFLNVFIFDVFLSREAEGRMIERELRKRSRSRR